MADKKITELPFITDITASVGSSPSNTTVIPVVLYGTTNQITADNLKENFIRNLRGTVKDIQTYTSSLKGAVTVRGNGIEVAGNLEVQGNMSVKGTLYTQYETSSIIYTSGSTKFGNSFDDLHETTGSVFFTGSHTINGEDYTYYSSSNSAVFTNFSSSNSTAITAFSSSNSTLFTTYSSSNSTLFTNFSSSNSNYNTTFSSSNEIYVTALSSSNSTYNTTFSSSNSTLFTNFSSSNSIYNTTFSSSNSTYNTTFSSSNATYVTALSSSNSTAFTNYSSSNSTTFTNYSSSTANTINGLSSGVSSELARVYQATASIQAQTSSLLAFTASQVDRNTNLSIVTGSLNNFTASQDSRNFVISQFTASTDAHIVGIAAFTSSQLAVNLGNAIYTSSVDSHIVGISTYTSSVRDTLARLHQSTASLQTFTASQDSRNFTVSQVTGSLIGITNGLMAFTAALDNTYATDTQLYQLYQATRSIELHSGSMIGITNALMAFTAALDNTYATDAQLFQLYQATRSIELTTGSLIGITNGLMAFTAALDSTYATDAQLYQLYAATASLNTATGSIKDEIAGIESYTSSLKAAAIVSSSTQITNYYKFAETASANTFYGTQTINGNLQLSSTSPLVYNAGNTNAMLFGFFDGGTIYGPYYQIFGSNYSNTTQRGSAEFVFDSRNGGYSGFNIAEFNGSTWLRKFRVSPSGAEVTGSFVVDGGITGSLMATNGVISSSVQLPQIAGLQEYTASLKNAFTIAGNDVNFVGKITAQEFTTVYTTSSVLFQSGSTKFGNSWDDKHQFTGSAVFSSSISTTGLLLDNSNGAMFSQNSVNGAQVINRVYMGYHDVATNGGKLRLDFVGSDRTTSLIKIDLAGSWLASNTENRHFAMIFNTQAFTNSSGNAGFITAPTSLLATNISTANVSSSFQGGFKYRLDIANPLTDVGETARMWWKAEVVGIHYLSSSVVI